MISPLQEKHTLNTNFVRFCSQIYPKQAFLEDMFGGVWKMTPKRPLTESKRTLFLQKRQILTPKGLKKQPFFVFLWSCMCTILLFNTIIQVAPLGNHMNTYLSYHEKWTQPKYMYVDDIY